MNDRDALYRTICANPHDDTPRLVFADWLQEHGDEPWAEFIRLQCRLANMHPGEEEYIDLKIREEQLIGCHQYRWCEDARDRSGGLNWHTSQDPIRPWFFRRGFPSGPSLRPTWDEENLDEFREALLQVIDSTPNREIELGECLPGVAIGFFTAPELEAITGLTLFINYVDGSVEARALAESPTLRQLRLLEFDTEGIGSAGLAALASSPYLHSLQALRLRLGETSDDDLRALLCSPVAGNLRELTLYGALRSGHIPIIQKFAPRNLHTLRLACPRGTLNDPNCFSRSLPSGLANLGLSFDVLATGPMRGIVNEGPDRLRVLNLSGRVPLQSIATLAEGTTIRSLRALSLLSGPLGERAILSLARSAQLAKLRRLTIRSGTLGPRAVRGILVGAHWRGLASLTMSSPPPEEPTDRPSLTTAIRDMDLTELRHLDLSGQPLRAAGAEALAGNPCLSQLRSLRLAQCGIGDVGAAALLHSPYLQNLEWLDLRRNRIQHGVLDLESPEVLPFLGHCDLENNPLTNAVISRLTDRPGVRR